MSKQKPTKFKAKQTRIKEDAKQKLEIIELLLGYSINFMQDKRDFCPCLKSILLRFFKTLQMNEKPLLAMKGNFSLNDDGIHAEKLEYQNLSEYHKIYSKN